MHTIEHPHEDCCIKYKLLVTYYVTPGRKATFDRPEEPADAHVTNVEILLAQVEIDKWLYDLKSDSIVGFERLERDLRLNVQEDVDFQAAAVRHAEDCGERVLSG